MHIEFNLPTGAGGQSALYFNTVLDTELAEWSVQYNVDYRKTLTYYKAWVWLPETPRLHTVRSDLALAHTTLDY